MLRRFLYSLAVSAALLASCTEAPEEQVCHSGGLTFNVTVNDTKAVKTAWEVGDVIYVFFDESATLGATSNTDLNYLVLTLGTTGVWEPSFHHPWTDLEAYLKGRSGGRFDAVFCPFGKNAVTATTYAEGPFICRQGCAYFLSQIQQEYSVSGNTVNLEITLSEPFNDVVQIFVDGLEQTNSTDWRLLCADESGNGGLSRFEGAVYDPVNHRFDRHRWAKPSVKNINGYSWKGGTVFYGIASDVTGDLTLTLTDNKTEGSAVSFVKTGITKIPKAIRISVEQFYGVSSYRTVLYSDGTLFIDEPGSRMAADASEHGEVLLAMSSWHDKPDIYNLSSGSKQPWAAVRDKIKSVRFGSAVQPVSTKYWFYNCVSLESFDAERLDMSCCTAMGMMFANVGKNVAVKFPLDLSSFDLSSLAGTQALQSVFQGSTGIAAVDISGWRIPAAANNCSNMFNGCSSLSRIYVDEGVDFSAVTTSTNMFKGCTFITGGNWFTYDEALTDKTYARVDTPHAEGYFTLKNAPAGYVHPGYWDTSAPTDVDSSLVGYTQSAFSVSQCIYTDEQKNQYVGYYNGNHEMIIAQRKLPNGPWRYCKVGQNIGWDSHNSITMAKDLSGRLHISGNMHAVPLVFFSTDESGNIATLRQVTSLVGRDETLVTYPKFITLDDGRLLFHYRTGSSGDGDEIYDILGDDGTWRRFLDTPLTDGEGLRNAYFIDAVKGPDGNYHIVWVWRETSMAETNHDLFYARTPDFKNWYAADGTRMTLPMKLSDKRLLVDPIPQNGGCLNGGQQIGFDAEGNPVIVYFKFDGNGYSQIYGARYRNGAWKVSRLTNSTWRWTIQGGGSLTKRISLGAPVLEPDGSITVVYHFVYEDAPQLNSEIWIDGNSFETVSEASPRSSAARFGSWVKRIYTPYSGAGTLGVKTSYDITGKPYMLRWESLGNFGDRKPTVEIPPASELRVVKLNY